ncbi:MULTISPECIES: methyl-accepting chemotaxis protein [unclassified Agarivorans]|uniref:methyl-accepting chemotaxis protein n=1 Tax=unclassified Agarivorans TaxID=2636026 RepID=UPI003D7CFBA4
MIFTIKRKLLFILSIFVLIIIVLGTLTTVQIQQQAYQTKIVRELNQADTSLYLARLAQADYMISEKSKFKENAYIQTEKTRSILNQVKSMMEVVSSKKEVENITNSVEDFIDAFSHFSTSKQNAIKARGEFSQAAASISSNIDNTLLSIDDFYSKNQHLFDEFGRYKRAKELKDKFNDLRVNIWTYNAKYNQESEGKIINEIENLNTQASEIKNVMLSDDTKNTISLLERNLQNYLALFKRIKTENSNLNQATDSMLSSAMMASKKMTQLVSIELGIAEQKRQQAITLIVLAIGISIVAAISMGYWLIRSIMSPLNQSIYFAQRISSGDLTKDIEIAVNDEFGSLNTALNESALALRKIISRLSDLTNIISESSTIISGSAKKSTESVQIQLSQTDMLASAIHEMAMSTNDISENAQNASDQSQTAENEAKSGIDKVKQTLGAINHLSQEMTSSTTLVSKLSDDSHNIASILNVIRSIADQTNLLALNAAIEAARAGEQGRGFSVVADEVRSLAQKTQNSIAEITNIINTIQVGAKNVVQAISSSSESTKEVVGLMELSGSAYDSIVNAIDEVSQMNTQVSVATEEQTSVAKEISMNVEQIKTLLEDNVQTLTEIETQIIKQHQQSDDLVNLVSFFKL